MGCSASVPATPAVADDTLKSPKSPKGSNSGKQTSRNSRAGSRALTPRGSDRGSPSLTAMSPKSPSRARSRRGTESEAPRKDWAEEQREVDRLERLERCGKKNPWERREDPTAPGQYFYVNNETGEQTRTKPPEFEVPVVKSTGLKGLRERKQKSQATTPRGQCSSQGNSKGPSRAASRAGSRAVTPRGSPQGSRTNGLRRAQSGPV